jgi:hypothetical protein
MHRREVIGLALLAVAIAVSAGFFVTGGKDDSGGRLAVASQTPAPAPTPVKGLIQAPGWRVQFLSAADPDAGKIVQDARSAVLDFSFDGAPVPGLKDDGWQMLATADFTLDPGRYVFSVEHRGPLLVYINNVQQAVEDAVPTAKPLPVEFHADGGKVTIRIVASDENGPFRLKFIPPDVVGPNP